MRLRDPAPKRPVFERPAPVRRTTVHERPAPRHYAHGGGVSDRAPEPVHRPVFRGSHADVSSPDFREGVARNAALSRARHANDAAIIRAQMLREQDPNSSLADASLASLRGWWSRPVTEGGLGMNTQLDWRFFGQPGRPAPATAKARFKSDVGQSVLTDDQAMKLFGDNIANADAFDAATHQIRAKKGYTGIDVIDVPQFKGRAAREKLAKDPEFIRLTQKIGTKTDGIPDRMMNVVRANAMGLPLSNQAIEQYAKDAADIVSAGFSPENVPGLAIPADQLDTLVTLKSQVAARGYDQKQIERMNFGQLIAAASAPKKAGTYVGRVIQNAPKSTARAIINFPGGGAVLLHAALQDASDYAAGHQGRLPDLHYGHVKGVPVPLGGKTTGQVVENFGQQLKTFGTNLWDDPAKAFEEDPAAVTLALYGLLKGGGAAHGKFQEIRGRLPESRDVTPGISKSTVSKLVPGRSPSPEPPLVVTMPGDPAPPPPHVRPVRGIEEPLTPSHTGRPYGHPQEPLTGIEAAIHEADQRELAARQRAVELGRPPVRGAIGNPATHRRELDMLHEAAQRNQKTIDSLAERLRDPNRNPTGNWVRETTQRLTDEIVNAHNLIQQEIENNGHSSGVGEIIIRNNQQLLDTIPEMARASGRRRRDIANQIVELRKRNDDIQRQIFNKHVDLNIPHPRSQTEVAKLHVELRNAIRERLPQIEIQRLQNRLEAVQNLGKPDPYDNVKRALQLEGHDLNEYVVPDETFPQNIVEIATGALRDSYHGHAYDNEVDQAPGRDVMHLIDQAVENALETEDNKHYPDMRHAEFEQRVETLARQHFGDDWRKTITHITPQDKLKIQGFLNDVVREGIAAEKEPRIAAARIANDQTFRPQNASFATRVMQRRIEENRAEEYAQQRRFTAKTDKGLKVTWARNAREAMATLEQHGFKVEDIELSKEQRRRRPDELTVEPAPRGTTLTRQTIGSRPTHVQFRRATSENASLWLRQDPASLPHPEHVVNLLEHIGPEDRDLFNGFKAEIRRRLDQAESIPDDTLRGIGFRRGIREFGETIRRSNDRENTRLIRDYHNALERMDQFEAETWPTPGELIPFTGPRHTAPPPEPVPEGFGEHDVPGGVQRYMDESTLPESRRYVSQNPPRMGFDEPPRDTGERTISPANQWLFKQREHETQLRSSEDIGTKVHRGYYSRNTVDRFFQRLRDSMLESENRVIQKTGMQQRFLGRSYAGDEGHARRGYYVKVERLLAPLREKASKLTQHELVAATQAHLQGVLPSDMLAFYNRVIEMKEHILKKENLPKELRDELRDRVPKKEVIDQLIDQIKDKPEYKPHVEWLQRFKRYLTDEDFLADNLFGDIIGKDWRISKDLRNAQKMWKDVVEKVGDDIGPEMHDYIGEARKASHQVDNELSDSGMFPKSVLDRRRLQRQRLVGAVLHKDLYDPQAIYVGDSAKATPAGRYLFRRVRTIDPEKVMGERAKPWSGSALMSGRINPSFANYYTGLTSAYSKSAALQFQREVLDKFGTKVKTGWESYDGRKYVLWNAEKGRPSTIVGIRDMMDVLNRNQDERFGADILAGQFPHQQDIVSSERPGRPISNPEDRKAQANGNLYLIPRDVYKKMDQIQKRNQLNSTFLRYFAKGTKAFRFVALALRPGYLIVNTAESAFRTGYFGGVTPAGFIRTARQSKEFRQAATPAWLSRSTLQRDILSVSHLGSKKSGAVSNLEANVHDTMARWNRAPFFGNAIDVGRWVAKGGPGDAILRGTSRAENYLRESMILSKQLKVARRHRYTKVYDFRRYFKGIDDTMRNLMEDIAADKPKHDEFAGKMDDIVEQVGRVLGDFSRHDRQVLSQIFPFWRWMAFITKFVMWESPVHYPARTFMLQQLGQMGYDELSKMGVMPPNIQGAIPVSGVHDEKNPDGEVDKMLTVMYTQAWNGMSSVPQMLGIDPATGEFNLGSGLIRNMNPFMQAAFTSLTMHDAGSLRQLKDKFGNPFEQTLPMYGEIFTANVLRAFWPLVLDYDYSQMADNSIPVLNQITKADTNGPLTQPQSSATQKITAILTGIRTRKLDLTKLQEKNMIDAATQVSSVYEALGDGSGNDTPAQQRFNQRFDESYMRQLQYMSEWVQRYADPSVRDDWRQAALQVAEIQGP